MLRPDEISPRWDDELGQPGWWIRVMLFATVAGGIVGVIGFLDDTLLICLFNWTGMIVVGTTVAASLLPALIRTARRLGLPLGMAAAVAVAATAVPISLAVALFSAWAWPDEISRRSAGAWYFSTLTAETFIVAAWAVLEYARHCRAVDAPPAGAQFVAGNTDVLCLQMEDHYVRIHRPHGSTLELMPMGAAIESLGRVDGLRVHRSWWVARAAISRVERSGRNWRLVLSNGMAVPVARSSIATVRQLDPN
ncbi:LytTR family DNA-binding domain-containing protein [Sphingomonas crusticola]|uniref:LytTR family DNA-binding domain-containing protein n=1 Tax=Sphingomonas crusticola TaxID=1697973 RepID=UPI000E26B49E|nr:LytTR family DNA-binding domain-containing protein [Sphingomonas crusticola]